MGFRLLRNRFFSEECLCRQSSIASVAVVFIVSSGILYHQMTRRAREADVARQKVDEVAERLALSESEVEELQGQLKAAHRERGTLQRNLQALRSELESQKAAEAEGSTTGAASAVESAIGTGPGGRLLQRIDEADALASEFFRRGDLEGLWTLGMELATFGEAGFEKIVEVAKQFETEPNKRLLNLLWREEEMLTGRFMADLTERSEDVLRLMLHLEEKDPETVPQMLGALAKGFSGRELGSIVLGMYDGDDSALLDRCLTSMHRDSKRLLESQDWRRLSNLSHAAAQIPSPAASAFLVDLVEKVPPQLQRSIVRSLAFQRTAEVLPVLRRLALESADSETQEVASAALQLLE